MRSRALHRQLVRAIGLYFRGLDESLPGFKIVITIASCHCEGYFCSVQILLNKNNRWEREVVFKWGSMLYVIPSGPGLVSCARDKAFLNSNILNSVLYGSVLRAVKRKGVRSTRFLIVLKSEL
ncbi:hypothetical protein AVEN_27095-1 [Araneus ventricosus]|uniref:Uncharacterized protein n=1 Tax=Araneus ventricosus TaxID=182803 RepID=A0A4Y2TS51_ARAVE|nr:hypothetical protein AVEN_27095-1 [Araneus ventricosus]